MLYCGDNLDIMREMPSESIDLTVTSPPYDDLRDYNGYTFDFEGIAQELLRLTKQGGVVVWVVADRNKNWSETGTSFRHALGFMNIGFNLFDTMIYLKENPNPGATGERGYHQAFEYMFVFSKGKIQTKNWIKDRKNKTAGKRFKSTSAKREHGKMEHWEKPYIMKEYGRRTNVWGYTIGTAGSTDEIAHQHPAIFPERLAQDHILSWSNEGDTVFDPMMGSGTTGKMALKHNRHFIGIDCSKEYVEIARQRLNLPAEDA